MQTLSDIKALREKQLSFFATGCTRDLNYRKKALCRLRESVKRHEADIFRALNNDLGKSQFEAYATETGIVLHELSVIIRNLKRWARSGLKSTPVFALPSLSYVHPEPYGRVLIISPWNYPFQLPMVPLAGAIAAGNVAIIRQSSNSPSINQVIRKIIGECFPEDYVALIECEHEVTEEALKLRWDMIFFTGSTETGRKIYSAAAANLTPVVLELGGKSPVIVAEDATISSAARKIIWGKLINSGQTCISPDHVFVHGTVKEKLINALILEIKRMYGPDPLTNPQYPKIISVRQLSRLTEMLKGEKIIFGGAYDSVNRKMEPTIVEATVTSGCMKDEIFGPILPVIEYNNFDDVIAFINKNEKPLAAYLFSSDRKKQAKILRETSSGACLFNEVVMHIANSKLPFGGVGSSGLGRYHGKESFRVFSNQKAVMRSSRRIDLPVKYPPFTRLSEWILKLFLR